MHRRTFMLGTGAAASLSIAGIPVDAAVRRPQHRSQPAASRYRMTLGCQSMPSDDQHFQVFARYGVRNISARAKVADGRMYPTVAELTTLKRMAERHGLSLDILEPELLNSTHIDREKHPGIMLGQDPDREREIEAFATTLRNCAAVGIPCVKRKSVV